MKPPPPDPQQVEALKQGTKAWLVPRLIVGMLLLVAFAVWIYWPRT